MRQLHKIRNVLAKKIDAAPHEVILVIDATTGQNGINQAKVFAEATDVTGIFLAKLDGTARGGIVIAIREQLNMPVKFIGVGETTDDVEPFESRQVRRSDVRSVKARVRQSSPSLAPGSRLAQNWLKHNDARNLRAFHAHSYRGNTRDAARRLALSRLGRARSIVKCSKPVLSAAKLRIAFEQAIKAPHYPATASPAHRYVSPHPSRRRTAPSPRAPRQDRAASAQSNRTTVMPHPGPPPC